MPSVSLTIQLASDSKVKCDVVVKRDQHGNKTWSRFGWSLGGLKFGPVGEVKVETRSGIWMYSAPDEELYLIDNESLVIFATATSVSSNFMNLATCGKSYGCDGEFWHNGGYRKTDWIFWFGCA